MIANKPSKEEMDSAARKYYTRIEYERKALLWLEENRPDVLLDLVKAHGEPPEDGREVWYSTEDRWFKSIEALYDDIKSRH